MAHNRPITFKHWVRVEGKWKGYLSCDNLQEPRSKPVALNDEYLVMKIPGCTYWSGRDKHYGQAMTRVCKILKKATWAEYDVYECQILIEYPSKGTKDVESPVR